MKASVGTDMRTQRNKQPNREFNPSANWFQFIVMVLALIGLGQVLSGGMAILHHLF
ncbi:hypothetical protein [Leptolyngbya ohadii]|uniref:hypothetical protein n=1 Tax=Leptolyngbya ohadii TaxID=1962290 RepID=UPI0015C58DF4|nr:hypothetical protein [Leptolyngbya ohadii]